MPSTLPLPHFLHTRNAPNPSPQPLALPPPPCTRPTPRTDALRFTLATGTSPGQDLNLSLDRVNAARNFTNKLWNAGKFILFNLDKVQRVRGWVGVRVHVGWWARVAQHSAAVEVA